MTARVKPDTKARTNDMIDFALGFEKIHVFDKETELTITTQNIEKIIRDYRDDRPSSPFVFKLHYHIMDYRLHRNSMYDGEGTTISQVNMNLCIQTCCGQRIRKLRV